MMGMPVDYKPCPPAEKFGFIQSMFCKGTFTFAHAVTCPHDHVINGLERCSLGYFDGDFQGIHNVELECLILFTNKGKLQELVAQVVPHILHLFLELCASRVTSELPADPKRRCQRRPDVGKPAQAVYDPRG